MGNMYLKACLLGEQRQFIFPQAYTPAIAAATVTVIKDRSIKQIDLMQKHSMVCIECVPDEENIMEDNAEEN